MANQAKFCREITLKEKRLEDIGEQVKNTVTVWEARQLWIEEEGGQ